MIAALMSGYPTLEPRGDYLRVRFGAAPEDAADFHWFWLRHNCDCCHHPLTGERTLCSSSIEMGIRPTAVAGDAAGVSIEWSEAGQAHSSRFAWTWLRENAYALGRLEVEPPPSDVARLELRADAIRAGGFLHAACMPVVARRGAVVVRGAGSDTEALIDDFTAGGYRVVETHFGRIEDLRTDNTTNRNTDQLGYTDAAVNLHTDQPFLERPPRYQMLHCMRPADRGGDNFIADAHQAARYLRSVDAAAFELLTTRPVRFLRRQKEFAKELIAPIIELRGGEVYRVRSSYFTTAPHRLPFDEMDAWYRAYNRFAALVGEPRHQYRFALGPGDFLLYDNFRMLHARTSFEGPRWVRGIYFDPEEDQ